MIELFGASASHQLHTTTAVHEDQKEENSVNQSINTSIEAEKREETYKCLNRIASVSTNTLYEYEFYE